MTRNLNLYQFRCFFLWSLIGYLNLCQFPCDPIALQIEIVMKVLLKQVTSGTAATYRIAPGHEKDLVGIEDLCSAIKTYANQVVRRDLAGSNSGEEQSLRLRKTIMDPLLDIHRILAGAAASTLTLYHAMHRVSNPGIFHIHFVTCPIIK